MKNKKAWVGFGLGLSVLVTPLLFLGTTRATPRVGTWIVGLRSLADWPRSYHHWNVHTRADRTKEVYESRSLLALRLSRPLRGPKAERMIAFYETLPKRPGTNYLFTKAQRW